MTKKLSIMDVLEGVEDDCLCHYLTQKCNAKDIADNDLKAMVLAFQGLSKDISSYLDLYADTDDDDYSTEVEEDDEE